MSTANVIQQGLNGIITLMLAKFMLNDVPHAAGLLGNMAGVKYTEAARKATVETIPEPRRVYGEEYIAHTTLVKDEFGNPVLEAVAREYDDKILLVTRYVRLGEAMKGYGTRAFVEGPLALSIKTGKPMVVDELSWEAGAFYKALEQKGIASLRMTPGEEHLYKVLPMKVSM